MGIPEQSQYRTDRLGFIGRHYLGRQLGHRVCQIYADSRKWDISNYPEGFFDSCLIDGGHKRDIVMSDTRKALQLVRSGGMILWHDFCSDPDVMAASETVHEVTKAITDSLDHLGSDMKMLVWIDPSMLLLGIRK